MSIQERLDENERKLLEWCAILDEASGQNMYRI